MPDISDHDLILEMRGDIKLLQADVREIKESQSMKLNDHETRIRFLEKWMFIGFGVIGFIQFALTIYVALRK